MWLLLIVPFSFSPCETGAITPCEVWMIFCWWRPTHLSDTGHRMSGLIRLFDLFLELQRIHQVKSLQVPLALFWLSGQHSCHGHFFPPLVRCIHLSTDISQLLCIRPLGRSAAFRTHSKKWVQPVVTNIDSMFQHSWHHAMFATLNSWPNEKRSRIQTIPKTQTQHSHHFPGLHTIYSHIFTNCKHCEFFFSRETQNNVLLLTLRCHSSLSSKHRWLEITSRNPTSARVVRCSICMLDDLYVFHSSCYSVIRQVQCLLCKKKWSIFSLQWMVLSQMNLSAKAKRSFVCPWTVNSTDWNCAQADK